jgi:hypothetical protein
VSEDPTIRPYDPLLAFCEAVLSRHRENWPLSEDQLAKEFLKHFHIDSLLLKTQLVPLGAHLGIEVLFSPMPEEFPGYHCSYEGRRMILLAEKEVFPGSAIHTLFHEVREIIAAIFSDLGMPEVKGKELEECAELFATYARMDCANQAFKSLAAYTQKIESPFWRWTAFIAACIFMLVHGFGCVILPQYEDQIIRRRHCS